MAESFELNLQIVKEPNGCYVGRCVTAIENDTEYTLVITGKTPVAILRGAANIAESKAHHPGPGRKPLHYWTARRLVNG